MRRIHEFLFVASCALAPMAACKSMPAPNRICGTVRCEALGLPLESQICLTATDAGYELEDVTDVIVPPTPMPAPALMRRAE